MAFPRCKIPNKKSDRSRNALLMRFAGSVVERFCNPPILRGQTSRSHQAKSGDSRSESAFPGRRSAEADDARRKDRSARAIPRVSAPGIRGECRRATVEQIIEQRGAGSMLWVSDPKEIDRFQHIAVEKSRLHIPILFGLDVIHGYHTIFPVADRHGFIVGSRDGRTSPDIAAKEARAIGIDWTFAPMVDIARDARWGRMIEGAGEDPYLGSAIARAQVLGFQGRAWGSPEHVLATAKHFAGYGAADGGRDYDASYIPEELMWNLYLPPFKAALDAGVATFMSAYMDLNDVPATGNRWLASRCFAFGWNFDGFVVSDANAVHSLIVHGYARDSQGRCAKGVLRRLEHGHGQRHVPQVARAGSQSRPHLKKKKSTTWSGRSWNRKFEWASSSIRTPTCRRWSRR